MNADATLDQLRVERDALDALVETAETIEKALQAWAHRGPDCQPDRGYPYCPSQPRCRG